MSDGTNLGRDDKVMPDLRADLAALTLRVLELERQVAQLRRERVVVREGTVPIISSPSLPVDPPPMPSVAAHGLAGQRVSPVMADHVAAIPATALPRKSFEDRLGSQIFNMIGIVALIFGMAWFLKLAIEYGWVGPVGRVLIGLIAGAGLVLWSERFRRKGFGAFSYSLKAVGSGVLYLSLWAAFQLYHLLPGGVALGAMIIVTAWIAFMAWSQNAELLAAYALAGGFATPLLLSTGGNHETFLFTYLAAIDVAAVLLLRWKPWQRLLIPAFLATVAYFIGWYARFFHLSAAQKYMDGESWETAGFVMLFFAVFAVVSIRGWVDYAEPNELRPGRFGDVIVPVLLPLANAAFVGLALYSVFEDSGLHGALAWLMVALAALYLGLMRAQATALAGAMHLAAAVIFLTIAIPLKASGHTLTIAWLVEGLVLFWASTRFEGENGTPSRILRGLSAVGYGLGLASLVVHWWWFGAWASTTSGFFNANLGSAMVAVATLAGAVWLCVSQPAEPQFATKEINVVWAVLLSIDLVGLLLQVRELWSQFGRGVHQPFANADFATALLGLAVLGTTAWAAYRLARKDNVRFDSCTLLAGGTMVAFNLMAILSVEREIGALWSRSEANVQRSLAISGFLMVYGAVLLATGFWRRNAFIRWQALILLIFTICKVFLYDISGLSAGYRVASFLALGALLMAVSFAYQKDWLGLQSTNVEPHEGER